MKLIIDIPETSLYRDMYTAICENGYIYDDDNDTIAKIIKDGIPLEEELEKIKEEIEEYRNCIPWDKECLIKFEAINYIYENIIWKHISELKGE